MRLKLKTKKWLIYISLATLAAAFNVGIVILTPETSLANVWKTSQVSTNNPQALLQQGREFFQLEQFSQAVGVWQQAVTTLKNTNDKLNLAQAYNLLSLAYQKLGNLPAAESAINSSLVILQAKENPNYSDKLSVLAQALNTQGHLQLTLGKSEQALDTWQQAAEIYSQIKDAEGLIGSQINQAQAMQHLGLYRRAKATLEQLESELKNQPKSLTKATVLRSLGHALRVIGELDKSRELLQESLEISQELASPAAISASQISLANTDRALAKKAEDLDNIAKARTARQRAINAYQETAKLTTSPKTRLQAQLNQLSLLIDNQDFYEAETLISQIQINELPPSRNSVYALINLAQSLTKLELARGSNPASISIADLLAKAVQQARILKDQQAESYALGYLGRTYELNGQFLDSFNLTQQALILAQSINASDIAYRWQWQLGRLLKSQGNNKQAIAAYSTAIETLKSLRNDLVAINPDNPDVQFSFRESVEPVYRELVALLLNEETQPSQENLLQARQVIESLQLAELDNFFQEACLDVKPVQIDKLDATAAVIYPIILPEKLAVILALPQSPLRYYSTIKPQAEVTTILNKLQQDIGRLAGNNQEVLTLSQQVYDWIVRPGEAELQQKNIQNLVFVLDGLLWNIPMAALHDGEKYLIEKYNIAMTPGLQLLPPQPLTKNRIQILAAGLSEPRQGFSALPNVKRELTEISKQVNSQELLNQKFTQNNLEKLLNSTPFPVIHIATHGQFSSQAQNTFILTWDNKINVKDLDSLLGKKERKAPNSIELLVFSACETAAGDNRAALGLAGVAVRAGARSTLATLWQVNDESTATLMVRFYEELINRGVTKAEALRRAQLSLLQEDRYKLPFFWAAYVLVGNWQ